MAIIEAPVALSVHLLDTYGLRSANVLDTLVDCVAKYGAQKVARYDKIRVCDLTDDSQFATCLIRFAIFFIEPRRMLENHREFMTPLTSSIIMAVIVISIFGCEVHAMYIHVSYTIIHTYVVYVYTYVYEYISKITRYDNTKDTVAKIISVYDKKPDESCS